MTDPTDAGYLPDPTEARPSSADRAADPPQGPGYQLRQARLRRGVELRQVARELRLTTDRVQALENDDYQALPDPVFVVGYIRTYARLLDLDPEALAEAYRALQAPKSARSAAPPARLATGSTWLRRHDNLWVAIAAVLLVILIVLAWWLPRRPELATTDPGLARPQPDPGALAPPAPRAGGMAGEGAGSLAMPDGKGATADADPLPEPILEEEEGAGPEAEPEPTAGTETGAKPGTAAAAPPGTGAPLEADVAQGVEKLDVVISFTGPTSVDIRDSTMNYALVGEMDQGDQHLLGGKPPYSLIIGNAAVTQIQVGGQPFDFQSVVKGNVARFILDPAPKASVPPKAPTSPKAPAPKAPAP